MLEAQRTSVRPSASARSLVSFSCVTYALCPHRLSGRYASVLQRINAILPNPHQMPFMDAAALRTHHTAKAAKHAPSQQSPQLGQQRDRIRSGTQTERVLRAESLRRKVAASAHPLFPLRINTLIFNVHLIMGAIIRPQITMPDTVRLLPADPLLRHSQIFGISNQPLLLLCQNLISDRNHVAYNHNQFSPHYSALYGQ